MKKLLSLLLTVMIGLSSLTLSAQTNTLLVADGTETNGYVPLYGYWLDAAQHNQIIYPSSMLGDMVGGSITSMTFYLNSTPSWSNSYVLSLGTTTVSEFLSTSPISTPVTQVGTGTISVQNNELTFTFTTPFDYNGGNLLFDITTQSASYSGSDFYGVSTPYNSALYSYNAYGSPYSYTVPFIPKVLFSFTGGATCLTPNNLSISNITTSSATFSWHNQSTGTSMVAIDTFGADESTLNWIPVADTTYTFTGINSGVHYQAFVRTDCGGGDLSAVNYTGFYTDCDVISSFPWTESFEGDWITTSAFGQNSYAPLCWKRYDGGVLSTGSTEFNWQPNEYSDYAFEGQGSATMYSYYAGDNHNDWLVTPKMTLTGTQHVTFMAKSSSSWYSLEEVSVWISDDNATLTAPASDTAALPGFTKIAQFNDLPTDFFLYEVSLAGYTGNRYIAFVRRDFPTSAYYLCLDNVVVEEEPSCLRPTALTVDSVSTDYAVFSWTSDASTFNLYYKTDDASDYTVINNVTLSADSTYTLTDLQPGQYYIWYVEAVCDDNVTLSSLLTEYPVAFVTECVTVTDLPMTCNFEHNNGAVNFTMPSCWDKIGYAEMYVDNYNYYAHSGDHSLFCYASSPQVVVLPELDNTLSIGNMQFSFWARHEYNISATTYPALIEIGVMTDPSDTSTFMPLDSASGFLSDYSEYVVSFEGYTGTANYVAMRINPGQYTYDGTYYYMNSLHIDDVVLELIPSCPRPEPVTITNLTDNSISLSWTSEESGFMVYYRESGTSAYTAIDDGPITDTFYTLTGLASSTNYELYVTSICSDQTETQSVIISFTTQCTPMDSLPYSCDFESYLPDTQMPICWTRGNGSTYAYPYVNDYNGYNSPKSLYFYYPNTAAMPGIDPNEIDLTEYRVTFYAYTYYAGDELQVGVMTDPADVSTFTPVATLAMTESFASYEVSLASYQGNGTFVAFRNVEESTYYVDNVVLEALPDCSRPTVFSSSLSTDEATITWEVTADQFEWEVAVGPSYSNPDTLPSEIVSTNSYTMDNLTPNTLYTIFVRTLCGSENSVWSDPYTFTTLLVEPAVLPYNCNFEDTLENANWALVNGAESAQWYIDTAANNTANGMYGLYISADSGLTNVYYTNSASVWAYRDIQFPEGDQFNITFDWRGYGESYGTTHYDYMKVFIGSPAAVSAGSYNNPAGATLLGLYNQQMEWQTGNIVLGSNYANTTKRLYFLWHNDSYASNQPPAAVDNITIDVVSCARPAAVELLSNGITSVTVGITPATEFDEMWQIRINDSIITVTDTVVTITGLTPATDYVVMANTICEAGDTSIWSIPLSFMTECVYLSTVPKHWDFESDIIGSSYAFPLCWNRISGNSTYLYPYIYDYSDYAHSGIHSLYYYNYYGSSIAIMPPIDTDVLNIQDLQVSFYAYTSDYSGMVSLQVGVMTDPSDASTFTNVETVSLPNNYSNDPLIVTFENYTGTGNYIAFKSVAPSNASSDISLDDVTLEEIPACPTPTAVTVSGETMTTATVSWTENGDATTWYLTVIQGDSVNTVTATSNPYTLTGLTSGTAYTVQVQSDCGTGETSGWSLPTAFNTALCEAANQCAYTFDLTDSYGDGWNGGYLEVKQNGITVYTITLSTGSTGTEVVNLCDGDSTTIVWFPGNYPEEPGFSVTAPDGTQLYTIGSMSSYTGFGFTPNCGGSQTTDPTVATQSATLISQTTATLNGTITNPDNVTITAKGFEWMPLMGTDYTQVTVTTTGNSVSYELTNLTPNTDYIFKAFITYNGTTVYGNDLIFTTLEQGQLTEPSATTLPATNVMQTTATLNGTISNPDNVTITAQGFEWKAASASSYTTVSATGATMASPLTGLTANTAYTYRAFVTTANGTHYGADVNFTTQEEVVDPCDVPTGLDTTNVANETISITWDANSGVSNWNIQYRPQNGTWTSANSATNSYTITGLTGSTTYEIQVQAVCSNGQTSDWSASLFVTTKNVGIQNWLDNSVMLYPTPAKEYVDIRVDGELNVNTMEVYDVYGKLVNTVNVVDNPTRINVSNLANGMYFVRVTTEAGVVTKSFVKK